MTAESTNDGEQRLRELKLIELLDVFFPGAIQGRVKITKSTPLMGELTRDPWNNTFLAPEEDYRGGSPMGSIRIYNLPGKAFPRFFGKIVKVAGVYEESKGLSVEAIALEGKPFED